jgi:hypothetical protein
MTKEYILKNFQELLNVGECITASQLIQRILKKDMNYSTSDIIHFLRINPGLKFILANKLMILN